MSAQHTPGPWFASFRIWTGGSTTRDDGGCFQILDHETESAANVLCSRNPWPERAGEMRANARLIAAAPELLAACNRALSMLGSLHPDGTDPYVIEGEASIRAAIAKATQESGEGSETP